PYPRTCAPQERRHADATGDEAGSSAAGPKPGLISFSAWLGGVAETTGLLLCQLRHQYLLKIFGEIVDIEIAVCPMSVRRSKRLIVRLAVLADSLWYDLLAWEQGTLPKAD